VLRIGLVSLLLAVAGCSTYRSELQRGQRYYEENKYETALALWRDLEADQSSLEKSERVRYTYLRGMTDFRLGYRPDARYWLGLAEAGEKLTPSSLSADEKDRLGKTLNELNEEVYGTGAAAPSESKAEQRETRPEDKTSDPSGRPCNWASECPGGFICQDHVCVEL
jgi:hypothetical protein